MLLQRRDAAVNAGIKSGASLDSIAGRVENATRRGIADVRAVGRAVGVARLRSEASALGRSLIAGPEWLPPEIARDVTRSGLYSESYAKQWLKKANEAAERTDTVAKAAKIANAESVGSLKRTAVTESSEAFSSGRAKYLRGSSSLGLLRVWDAQLDSCPICQGADGTIVGAREPFPLGEPGSVHAWCRCSWTLLSTTQSDDQTLIQPVERPAQVSVPAKVMPAKAVERLPSVSPLPGGKIAVDAETKAWAKRLDVALGNVSKDGGKAARVELRAMLDRFGYKGARKLEAGHDLIKIADSGDMAGMSAYADWDGSIALSDRTLKRSRGALRKMQLGADPGEDAHELSALLHEELHGASALKSTAYQGHGAALEEATTELAARRITAKLTGRELSAIYNDEIDGLKAVVARYSKAKPAALAAKIDSAISTIKSKAPLASTPAEHVEHFVKALKLTPKQSASVLKDLADTEWWKPGSTLTKVAKPKPTTVKATKPKTAAKPRAPPKKKAEPKPAKPTAAEIRAEKARAAEAKAAKARAAAEAKAEKAAEKKALAAADKLSDAEIKATLKRYGVKVTGKVSEELRLFFGSDKTPSAADLKAMLGLDSIGATSKFKGEFKVGRFNLEYRGATANSSVSISRSYRKDLSTGEISAKHDSLYLSKYAQGKKLGSAIVREQVEAYERLGIKSVTLNSAEVGRYYWPKIGFEGSADALASAKAQLGTWLERNGVRNARTIAGAPRSMREIATLQVGDRRVGKEFLLSKDYGGDLLRLKVDRADPSYQIFRQEFGLEPGAAKPAATIASPAKEIARADFDRGAKAFESFIADKPERAAFDLYTGEHYKRINGQLRDGKPMSAIAESIQDSLAQAHKRGLSVAGDVYRGTGMSNAQLAQLADGVELQMPGFLSTTIDRDRALRYTLPDPGSRPPEARVVLKIRQQTAVPIDAISVNKGEQELLMRHNSRFRVISRTESTDRIGKLTEVELEEIL